MKAKFCFITVVIHTFLSNLLFSSSSEHRPETIRQDIIDRDTIPIIIPITSPIQNIISPHLLINSFISLIERGLYSLYSNLSASDIAVSTAFVISSILCNSLLISALSRSIFCNL